MLGGLQQYFFRNKLLDNLAEGLHTHRLPMTCWHNLTHKLKQSLKKAQTSETDEHSIQYNSCKKHTNLCDLLILVMWTNHSVQSPCKTHGDLQSHGVMPEQKNFQTCSTMLHLLFLIQMVQFHKLVWPQLCAKRVLMESSLLGRRNTLEKWPVRYGVLSLPACFLSASWCALPCCLWMGAMLVVKRDHWFYRVEWVQCTFSTFVKVPELNNASLNSENRGRSGFLRKSFLLTFFPRPFWTVWTNTALCLLLVRPLSVPCRMTWNRLKCDSMWIK